MTRLLEQTWNLNLTPREGPDGQLLVEVEGGLLMSGPDFVRWLHEASQSPDPALRPASRNSIEVWRDTRESPQPKAKLREMDEFALQYKKLKRKWPGLGQEELRKKTQEALDAKRDFLENFAELALEDLLGGAKLPEEAQFATIQATPAKEPHQ